MEKIIKLTNTAGKYLFSCPGCQTHHAVWTANEGFQHPIWGFNGDTEKPTITGSILVRVPKNDKTEICHSFIKDGMIQFLGDCTHHLAGQTVELPDMD